VGGRESAKTVRKRQLRWREQNRKAWRRNRAKQKLRYYRQFQKNTRHKGRRWTPIEPPRADGTASEAGWTRTRGVCWGEGERARGGTGRTCCGKACGKAGCEKNALAAKTRSANSRHGFRPLNALNSNQLGNSLGINRGQTSGKPACSDFRDLHIRRNPLKPPSRLRWTVVQTI